MPDELGAGVTADGEFALPTTEADLVNALSGRVRSLEVSRGAAAVCSALRERPCMYTFRACGHPLNLATFAGLVALSFIFSSAWIAVLAVVLEVAFLATVPRARVFRRSIDRARARAARQARERDRAALVARLADEHRGELAKLQALVARMREHPERVRAPLDADSLDRLVGTYIRLALRHKAASESLALSVREPPEATIRALEASGARPAPCVAVKLLDQRVAIAERRMALRAEVRAELESASQAMAAVFELAHLAHERALAPARVQGIADELAGLMREIDDREAVMLQVDELELEGSSI